MRKEDIDRYGHSPNCERCKLMRLGRDSTKPHSNSCRDRIAARLVETPEGKRRVEEVERKLVAETVRQSELQEAKRRRMENPGAGGGAASSTDPASSSTDPAPAEPPSAPTSATPAPTSAEAPADVGPQDVEVDASESRNGKRAPSDAHPEATASVYRRLDDDGPAHADNGVNSCTSIPAPEDSCFQTVNDLGVNLPNPWSEPCIKTEETTSYKKNGRERHHSKHYSRQRCLSTREAGRTARSTI